MPRYNMRKGRPLSRSKRPLASSASSHRPLQPAPALQLSDGKVKLRLLPAGITVTHPIVSIQSSESNGLQLCQSSPAAIQPPPVDIDTSSNDSLSSALAYFDNRSSVTNSKADQFLDSVIENSNSSVLQTPPRVRPTPPTSPSRAVSSDTWLPDLSSFLHLNSSNSNTPTKSALGHNDSSKLSMMNDDSVQSNGSEVDRQLLSMMTESSVDFTSKFATLASAVVGHSEEMQ